MLRTKRVYDPLSPDDGERILVDRLWPRGLSRAEARVQAWLKDIAPSDRLRRWFHADGARWADVYRLYRRELEAHRDMLTLIRKKAARAMITLLYAAREPERNNAAVLAELIVGRRRRKRVRRRRLMAARTRARRRAYGRT
jgi:uncharacterized protein YeaO (DUF488 family)